MTVYVCGCGRKFLFMSLAVLCAEGHPVGVSAGGCAVAPVTVRRAG